jgi:hypothetical protein
LAPGFGTKPERFLERFFGRPGNLEQPGSGGTLDKFDATTEINNNVTGSGKDRSIKILQDPLTS